MSVTRPGGCILCVPIATKPTFRGKMNLVEILIALLWYGLGRPVITSEIDHCSVFVSLGWRFVFGITMK